MNTALISNLWKKIRYPQRQQSTILVIGDACIDKYIQVFSKKNLEKDVPAFVVNNNAEVEDKPGMAANVVATMRKMLQGPVPSTYKVLDLTTNPDEMCLKVRFMLGEITTLDSEYAFRIDYDKEAKTKFSLASMPAISSISAIVISDYCKGFLTDEDIKAICSLAKQHSIPLFIDTKRRDLSMITYGFVKINKSEADSLVNLPRTSLIVTMGSMGAFYAGDLHAGYDVPVLDTCGAGDAFLSGLVINYLETKDINKALAFANATAAVSVQHYGCYAPHTNEINSLLQRHDTLTRKN